MGFKSKAASISLAALSKWTFHTYANEYRQYCCINCIPDLNLGLNTGTVVKIKSWFLRIVP